MAAQTGSGRGAAGRSQGKGGRAAGRAKARRAPEEDGPSGVEEQILTLRRILRRMGEEVEATTELTDFLEVSESYGKNSRVLLALIKGQQQLSGGEDGAREQELALAALWREWKAARGQA
jgi:ATP-dependent DNA ligase